MTFVSFKSFDIIHKTNLREHNEIIKLFILFNHIAEKKVQISWEAFSSSSSSKS